MNYRVLQDWMEWKYYCKPLVYTARRIPGAPMKRYGHTAYIDIVCDCMCIYLCVFVRGLSHHFHDDDDVVILLCTRERTTL